MFKKSLFATLLLFSNLSSAQSMELNAGLVSVGGHLLAQGVLDKNGNYRIDGEMAPELGVFVIDGLEAFARFRLSGPLHVNASPNYEPAPLRYGASLGLRYFWDAGACFYPYTGLLLGADAVATLEQRYWSVEIPLGVMISLNESVGMTIGAAVRAEMTFYDTVAPSLLYFPFGIFGIKAIF